MRLLPQSVLLPDIAYPPIRFDLELARKWDTRRVMSDTRKSAEIHAMLVRNLPHGRALGEMVIIVHYC